MHVEALCGVADGEEHYLNMASFIMVISITVPTPEKTAPEHSSIHTIIFLSFVAVRYAAATYITKSMLTAIPPYTFIPSSLPVFDAREGAP